MFIGVCEGGEDGPGLEDGGPGEPGGRGSSPEEAAVPGVRGEHEQLDHHGARGLAKQCHLGWVPAQCRNVRLYELHCHTDIPQPLWLRREYVPHLVTKG